MKKRLKAFTAVEVTMVAAVIAILALIILPLFQKRADNARIAAAQDDMSGLAKAEILANADTDWYFRLHDLDNTKIYPGTADQVDLAVPYAIWDRALSLNEREVLARRWEGPYIAIQSYTSSLLGVARAKWNAAFFTPNGQGKSPIFVLAFDNNDDKIPLDPWGGPYIFFAPSETEYNYPFSNAVIYSMGPDGLPGDGSLGVGGDTLVRDSTDIYTLGNGDDFKYVF
jgi:type II secretory pathway pseudopilin PulG